MKNAFGRQKLKATEADAWNLLSSRFKRAQKPPSAKVNQYQCHKRRQNNGGSNENPSPQSFAHP
jgi:hypothetical protein